MSVVVNPNVSGSGTLLNTKGDLLTYDTAPIRFPDGTDGQVLTADSTQTAGIKWANTASTSTTLTGDATGTGTGTVPVTLAAVNSNIGTFGDATDVAAITVNAKGLITSVSNIPITFPPSVFDVYSYSFNGGL